MDIEFHYYITAILALRAGFTKDEAYVLAYSSQYTDDNTAVFKISEGTSEGAKDEYSNYISQTSNILKAEKELMQIYPIFHFLPGDKEEIESDGALRRDGKLHVLNTIPDNGNARFLEIRGCRTGDGFRFLIRLRLDGLLVSHMLI